MSEPGPILGPARSASPSGTGHDPAHREGVTSNAPVFVRGDESRDASGFDVARPRFGGSPTAAEVDAWFDADLLPRRTASAGFSANRIWRGPLSLIRGGNAPDPNGLCGDVASYVWEQFFDHFKGDTTSDGRQIAMVVWRSHYVGNHIANVLLDSKRTTRQSYEFVKDVLTLREGEQEYDEDELLKLRVYDLYYKKRSSLGEWWEAESKGKDGWIRLSLYHDTD